MSEITTVTPAATKPDVPVATAALVLGTIGLVVGIIPILFIVAWALGIPGLILGIAAWRSKPRRRLARTATVLALLAIFAGVAGAVAVSNAVDDLDRCLEDSSTC